MRTLKRILLVAVVVVLLGLGALYAFLDPLVGRAIEKGSTYATGVETHVGSVDASLMSGRFGLSDFSLANPTGFGPDRFISLRSGRASWQNGSILSNTIEMDEFVLEGVEVRLEKTASGSNWGAILDHLEKLSHPPQKTPAPAPAAGSKSLHIKKIEIRDVTAHLRIEGMPLVSGSTTVKIPSLVVEDFRSDGSTTEIVGKLTRAIVQAVLEGVAGAGQNLFPPDVLKDLGHDLGGLRGAVEGSTKDLLKSFDGVLKDAGGLFKPK